MMITESALLIARRQILPSAVVAQSQRFSRLRKPYRFTVPIQSQSIIRFYAGVSLGAVGHLIRRRLEYNCGSVEKTRPRRDHVPMEHA